MGCHSDRRHTAHKYKRIAEHSKWGRSSMKDCFQGTVCSGEAAAKSAEACLPVMVRIRGDGRPAWKPFVPASNVVMVLDQSVGMQPHPRALQLDFLQANSTE
jgi:hypothetical protein